MAGNITHETAASVEAFLDSVEHQGRRADAHALVKLMRRVTGVKLGKHKTGGSCLYINKLADVDLATLEAMVARSWELSLKARP
jgi:hypothetical protein